MKILLVSSYLPYPLYSGGHVRLYNLIRELSKNHEITLICEKRTNQTDEDISEIEKLCKKVITVKRRKQWSLSNILKSTISVNSFLVTGHTNKDMQKKIQEELKSNNFDLIHVETFYVMQNLPKTSLPIVLAEHNIEYQVYTRFADHVLPVLRPLLGLDIAKLKREEENAWKKSDRLVSVSEADKKIMESKGVQSVVVANGVDIEKFNFEYKKDRAEKKILFIGDFKWIQNKDSARWITKEVLPQISTDFKVKLWIVSRQIPDSIKQLIHDPRIVFDEQSSNRPTEELFHEADILLSPIRVGGGTSYKILEAMSCGTPVVTTSMSADAIGAKDGVEIMVGENTSELAERVSILLSNRPLFEQMQKNGRKLIEENYTWTKIAKVLESVYKTI